MNVIILTASHTVHPAMLTIVRTSLSAVATLPAKSQYRSRSRLNEQHRFQWIRFSCEIMLFRSHPHSQWLTSFVHLVRKGNGFCVINQDISHWIPQPTRLTIRALEDISIFANLCVSNQSSWFCENQPRKHSVKSLTISVSQNTPLKIF